MSQTQIVADGAPKRGRLNNVRFSVEFIVNPKQLFDDKTDLDEYALALEGIAHTDIVATLERLVNHQQSAVDATKQR